MTPPSSPPKGIWTEQETEEEVELREGELARERSRAIGQYVLSLQRKDKRQLKGKSQTTKGVECLLALCLL